MAHSVRFVSSAVSMDTAGLTDRDASPPQMGDAPLAFQLLEEGRAADAIEVARAGLEKRPRSPELLLLLGRGLVVSGELGQARRVLLEGTMLAPADTELAMWLAQVMLHLGESDRSVRVLQRAIRAGGIDDRLAELYARAHLAWEQKKKRGRSHRPETFPASELEATAPATLATDDDKNWEALLAKAKAEADRGNASE